MDAWDRLKWLFEVDDGGLYDICLIDLDENRLVRAFDFVVKNSRITPDTRFWHREHDRECLVADYPDAPQLVARQTADAFHTLASGFTFGGVVLPDLGVFVWPDELTFDYRMGPEWGRAQLFVLFELLRQVVVVSGGRIRFGKDTHPDLHGAFVREWEDYCRRV